MIEKSRTTIRENCYVLCALINAGGEMNNDELKKEIGIKNFPSLYDMTDNGILEFDDKKYKIADMDKVLDFLSSYKVLYKRG